MSVGYAAKRMRGMQAVAWRNLKRRKARAVLTGVAIALGVANVFGVMVANTSTNREVERRAREFIGGADVQVHGQQRPGLLQSEVEGLEELPDTRTLFYEEVGFVVAGPIEDEEEYYYLSDLDAAGSREFLAPRLKRGRLPQPGSREAILTEFDAARLGVDEGDRLTEWVPPDPDPGSSDPPASPAATPNPEFVVERLTDALPPITLVVAGIIEDDPSTGSYAGAGSYTVELSRRIYEPSYVTRIRILLDRGVDPLDWVALHEGRFPDVVFQSASGTAQVREVLDALQTTLAGASAVALFVGAFLIYLVFSLALVERTRLYGLLHAVGATRLQVASSVLTEAAILGIIATALGIGLGVLIAWGVLALVAQIGELGIHAPISITGSSLASGLTIGFSATAVGAAVPAFRASRSSPVEAIRGPAAPARGSRTWIAGLSLFSGGLGWVVATGMDDNITSQISVVMVMLGAVLAVPAGVWALAHFMRRVAGRAVSGLSVVAVSHVTRERSRSAYTVGLVMTALAVMFTLAASNLSLQRSLDRWLDTRFGADLNLYGPEVDDALEEKARAVRGVAGVTRVVFGQHVNVTAPVLTTENLLFIDPESFFDVAGFPWTAGSDDDARRALMEGGSVLLRSRFAVPLGIVPGDTVRLTVEEGELDFEVSGIYTTGAQFPEVGIVASFFDRDTLGWAQSQGALHINFSGDETADVVINRLGMILTPDDSPPPQRSPDAMAFGRGFSLGPYYAITGAEIKDRARTELDSYIRLFAAVLFVVVIVGALGLATTLAGSVLLRSREIGTLQAVGAPPHAIRRLILAESLTLVLAALVLATLLGVVLSWMFIQALNATLSSGVTLAVPWRFLPLLAALALAIALIAGILPARRAARMTPVEALRYE